jgi:hypothetical protein
MKVRTNSGLLTVALSILAGCASVSPATSPGTPPVVSFEQVVERSYTLGKEHVAFVGGVIARVKDYRVEKTTRQGSMHASRDFSLFYPILGPTVHVKTTDVIPIVGTTERDGATYRLISLPRVPLVKLLITDDGRLEGSGLGLGDARMGYNYSTDPPGVMFQLDTSTSTVTSAGYLNFELVYSGVTKDSVRLLYREYTQQDLVRPAFSQDVVYERDASTIRFRNVLIRVLQAAGEQIRFAVLEDGYPPQK